MQSNWRPWNDFWLKWSYKSRSLLWVIFFIARIWYGIYGILIHTMYMIWIQLWVVYIFWNKLVLKATINNISIIPWCHGLLLEEREYLNKTTGPAEVTYNIYHIQLYRVHLAIHYEVGLLKQNHRPVARTQKMFFRDFDNAISWLERNKIIVTPLVCKNLWLSVDLRGNFKGYI
jgi:hypothetical protein